MERPNPRRPVAACLSLWCCIATACSALAEEPVVLPPPGIDFSLPPIAEPVSGATNDTEQQSITADDSQLLIDSPEVIETTPILNYHWYELAYWFGPEPWDIGFELGLNGAAGINEALSMRTGGYLKRETKFWKFDTSLVYNRNNANGLETQNNALLDVRIDRLIQDSPWTLYFLNQELYDEFQAFDLRVSLNAGLGYQLFDTEVLELMGRFGAGASREFGGPDDRWAREALFGIDYLHHLTPTQRLSATVDYYPEWKNFGLYRIVADIGWEIDLDQPRNVSLKFSVLERYDSTPNGVDPNELNYAALLIWGL